jgi:antitoxin component of MazEF toxin-antitoxin module
MSTLKIRKVGNSLGVIFSKEIQEILNISDGDIIDVTNLGDNKVLLDSHLPHHSSWKFKNSELNTEENEWINSDLEDENDKIPRW